MKVNGDEVEELEEWIMFVGERLWQMVCVRKIGRKQVQRVHTSNMMISQTSHWRLILVKKFEENQKPHRLSR